MPLEHLAEHLKRVGELGLSEGDVPGCALRGLPLRNDQQVDRMYALLVMCGFSGDSIPYVSYTESVTEVYMRFNRYIIERNADDTLVLLSTGVASPQGPSWSPNWSLELWNSTSVALTFTRDLDRYDWRDGVYQAPHPVIFPRSWTNRNRYAFRAGGELKFPFTFSSNGKCLLAKGAISASAIRRVGPVFWGRAQGSEPRRTYGSMAARRTERPSVAKETLERSQHVHPPQRPAQEAVHHARSKAVVCACNHRRDAGGIQNVRTPGLPRRCVVRGQPAPMV